MNLGDPELELIDPTPNVHTLFIHFDNLFFWTKLASRAVVRWSKRMYSCAGICSYEGRGGLCDIALSEPLLKLRPRKDLIETLLHEMIHAFLFVTCKDQDRDGHGPNFKAHMHRINNLAGVNITIYHDFHDEVKLYQTHWWRCDGPCQSRKPYFGIVRRTANRQPGPKDFWWKTHQRTCGGKFVKIKEPENYGKKKSSKPNVDITKFINNNKIVSNKNVPQVNQKPPKGILKDFNNVPDKPNVTITNNDTNTVVIKQQGNLFSPQVNKKAAPIFSGKGQAVDNSKPRRNSVNIVETVRNVWVNKEFPKLQNSQNNNSLIKSSTNSLTTNKYKHESDHVNSPPSKVKKIDDYFKKVATSILKDVYGEDFKVTQSKINNKVIVSTFNVELVNCPICNAKINNSIINKHIDECLNKGLIETLCTNNPSGDKDETKSVIPNNVNRKELKELVGVLTPIPLFATKQKSTPSHSDIKKEKIDNLIDLTVSSANNEKMFTSAALVNSYLKFPDDGVKREIMIAKKINNEKQVEVSSNCERTKIKNISSHQQEIQNPKVEPEISNEPAMPVEQKCPCCGSKIDKPIEEHLDECLAFFDNNTTVPEEGASTSFANETILIDDDDFDIFDETLTLNATGTKYPCPCCLKMVEQTEMNQHLDICLS